MSLRTRWRPGDRFLVRYKDQNILVVDKKAGVLTVKTPTSRAEDLMSLLREFTGSGRRRNPIYCVHRLDRVVSGLLVVARTARARDHLIEQFKVHSVERKYICAVSGIVKKNHGTFRSHMKSAKGSLKMASDPSESGKRAVTHFKVLERYEQADATLLEVRLETGLRNQIRVHFSEAGHPLLGEKKYFEGDDEESSDARQGRQRIFLHAEELGFVHPITNKPMHFSAKLPPDLERWQRALARGTQQKLVPRRKGPKTKHRPKKRRR